MGFWFPYNSIETSIMTGLSLFAIVYSSNKNWQVSLALFVSLFAAKYLTNIGLDFLHMHFLFVSAMICIADVKNRKLKLLPKENTLNYVVSYIFGIRILVSFMFFGSWINTYYIWIASMVLLGAQIFAILRGSDYADGIRSNNPNWFDRTSYNHAFASKQAMRD